MTNDDVMVEQFADAIRKSMRAENLTYKAAERAATALLPLIREAQADAWDEGWKARAEYDRVPGDYWRGDNSYRKEQ